MRIQRDLPFGGRIADLGADREISTARDGREMISIRFDKSSQVTAPAFKAFLREHVRGK